MIDEAKSSSGGTRERAGWVVSSTSLTPGWMQLPANSAEVDDWATATTAQILEQWKVSHSPEIREVVQDLLLGAWEHRDEDALLNLVCWPRLDPVIARVSVRVTRPISPGEWKSQGFRVEPYRADAFGQGVLCTSVEGLGETSAVSVAFVFYRDDDCVVVTLAPVLAPVFDAVAPGLHLLVSQLEIVCPNGERYVPDGVSGYVLNEFDEWQVD